MRCRIEKMTRLTTRVLAHILVLSKTPEKLKLEAIDSDMIPPCGIQRVCCIKPNGTTNNKR